MQGASPKEVHTGVVEYDDAEATQLDPIDGHHPHFRDEVSEDAVEDRSQTDLFRCRTARRVDEWSQRDRVV